MSEKNQEEQNLSLASESHIRREKVKELESMGVSPWPEYKPVDLTADKLSEIAKGNGEKEDGKEFAFSGRVMARREHGKTCFLVFQDRTGSIQGYFKKDILGDESFAKLSKFVDTGDYVWIKGSLFLTKTGEPTIKASEWQLTSKCLNPLAEKYHGLTDTEQRYRQRYLDLISNRDSFDKFKKRSEVVQEIRRFLTDKDFLEVETPMLHPIPGGAAARPFITHHNTYDFDLYLRIAPELYLKRLVVGGMERVFEINRNFRNEGISTKHNPEFTMLEFYMAHGDYEAGINLTEELIRAAAETVSPDAKVNFSGNELDFSKPFERLSVAQAVEKFGGISSADMSEDKIDAVLTQNKVEMRKGASYGEKIFALFEAVAEDKIVQPTFVVGYPIEVSPLAKRDPKDPKTAARFELFICGMELSNGFTELNDPFDQAQRFKDQVEAKDAGDDEAHHYDADYVTALEYGLPPTVGVGIGIDRLVMLLTDTQSIKDVILFPTLRPRGVKKTARRSADAGEIDFCIDDAIFSKFPEARVGFVRASFNNVYTDELEAEIDGLKARLATYLETQAGVSRDELSAHPAIEAWRRAYKSFGVKPSKYPCSVEALCKRVLKREGAWKISPAVDLYNIASVMSMLPMGGYDVSKLSGNQVGLNFAKDGSTFKPLGKDDIIKPTPEQVVWTDSDGERNICWLWNYKDSKYTGIGPKTTEAVFFVDSCEAVGLEPKNLGDPVFGTHLLALLIETVLKGTVKARGIATASDPIVSIDAGNLDADAKAAQAALEVLKGLDE